LHKVTLIDSALKAAAVVHVLGPILMLEPLEPHPVGRPQILHKLVVQTPAAAAEAVLVVLLQVQRV
jgi:hypothetical protein